MADRYLTVAGTGVHEIEIRRSRFLCALAPVTSEEAAREVIAARKKADPAARHHCHAFVLGADGRTQRSSDDGEPAGTAGTPMLEVLRRRELTDTVAVVTRYFGGVLLGAGGLIRAYGQAVSEAVDVVGVREYRRRGPGRGDRRNLAAHLVSDKDGSNRPYHSRAQRGIATRPG